MPRILVADDDLQFATVTARTLGHRGHDVELVPHGGAALAFLDARPVDLLLLDVMMPEKDGFETLNELRARAVRPPIILMSGGSDRYSREYLLTVGRLMAVEAVLEKPFGAVALLEAVEQVLARIRPAVA
jgi:CheY-like chemotaxis protein